MERKGRGGGLVGLKFINATLKLVVDGFYSIVLVLEYIAPIVEFSTRPSDLKQILFLFSPASFELDIFSLQFIVNLRLGLELALKGS